MSFLLYDDGIYSFRKEWSTTRTMFPLKYFVYQLTNKIHDFMEECKIVEILKCTWSFSHLVFARSTGRIHFFRILCIDSEHKFASGARALAFATCASNQTTADRNEQYQEQQMFTSNDIAQYLDPLKKEIQRLDTEIAQLRHEVRQERESKEDSVEENESVDFLAESNSSISTDGKTNERETQFNLQKTQDKQRKALHQLAREMYHKGVNPSNICRGPICQTCYDSAHNFSSYQAFLNYGRVEDIQGNNTGNNNRYRQGGRQQKIEQDLFGDEWATGVWIESGECQRSRALR